MESGGLGYQLKVLHHGRCGEKWPHHRAPGRKGGRAAKAHRVVFQRFPKNLQHVALWAFDAAVDLESLESFESLMNPL